MKSGKKKRKLVKKKSKKDFRPSRSSFHFPYFNRTQALCVAVCFWSEDWVGFGGMGTSLFKLVAGYHILTDFALEI